MTTPQDIRAVIVDDEPEARGLFRRLIGQLPDPPTVIGEADDVASGCHTIRRLEPDLVFLDINLRSGTGFDLLNQLPNLEAEVIFVTAHDDFALKAFDFAALGYLLKPLNQRELTAAVDLRSAVDAAGVEVLTDAVVTGRYDGNWVAVLQRGEVGDARVRASASEPAGGDATITERLVKVRVSTLVVAPGLIERPYVFAGNDLPGVMLSTGVRRLINLYAVRPGTAAVVLTANADGDAAVADLERVGVDVRAVVDARGGEDIVRAHGRGRLQAVECADGRTIECDLLVTATGWTAPWSF